MSNKYRHKKVRMYNESPYCRRCGVFMWLPPSGYNHVCRNLPKEEMNTMATIAHKYSRLDPRRWTEGGLNKQYQLICHKCNVKESDEEIAKLSKEELWARSNAYPKDHPMSPFNELNKYNKKTG